jgi:hypothetical protein
VARKESAERVRQAAVAQRKQQEALRAHQEAAAQAQREQAAALIIGGILQTIINHHK